MNIVDKMIGGEPARLIPILSEGKKEERATSALMAAMSVVPEFAKQLLAPFGAKITARTAIECYTEVRFRDSEELRPDGLITVRSGKKEWAAILESKVGNSKLDQAQFDKYAALARKLGIDALITISNQYALRPDHHPLSVPNRMLQKVKVGHLSWLAVRSETMLLCANKGLSDPEQAYIMTEFLRFLEHPASGVSARLSLSKNWPELCDLVQNGASLSNKGDLRQGATADWHQIAKFVSLSLAMKIERPVSILLSARRRNDPDFNFKEDMKALSQAMLETTFEIFGCREPMTVRLDFNKRTLEIETPRLEVENRPAAKSAISWVTKQIKQRTGFQPLIKLWWPNKKIPVDFTLAEYEERKGKLALPAELKKSAPARYQIATVLDLGADIKRNKLSDEIAHFVESFYETVLQNLKAPKAQNQPNREGTVHPATAQRPLTPDSEEPVPSRDTEISSPDKTKDTRVFFRILPVRERRYLDDRYN